MTTIGEAFPAPAGWVGILDRERIIAQAGFNRWLVPPAALCIHLCIGMAYGFSVYIHPMLAMRQSHVVVNSSCHSVMSGHDLTWVTPSARDSGSQNTLKP